MSQVEKHTFQAEIQQLLSIVIHSLYTNREVFVRELISNAADGCEKLRFLQTSGQIPRPDDGADPSISISSDETAGTLTIADTGIGMTRDELVENLGTIAHSGTKAFLKAMAEKQMAGDGRLIGQFGVGFYSAFMVAQQVTVFSRSHLPDSIGAKWESEGGDGYSIETSEEATPGTRIVLTLKEDAKEFAKGTRLETVIKQYSNFVSFPIELNGKKVNTVQAIWARSKSEVKDEEYLEFYKYVGHDFEAPRYRLHFTADAPLSIQALLFVPTRSLELPGMGRTDPEVHLYCRKVLIEAKPKNLFPEWLRFLRGVVDCEDLPLNVSRERMQDSDLLKKLNRALTNRFLKFLAEEAEKSPETYLEFYTQFSRYLKEGALSDFEHQQSLAKLLRYESSGVESGKKTSLAEYVKRMPEGQTEIYFLLARDRAAAEASPYFEVFQARKYEVLFVEDPVDEFVLDRVREFEGKSLKAAERADLKLEQPPTEGVLTEEESKAMSAWLKETLGEEVEEVRASDRLVESPVVVVERDSFMTGSMRRTLKLMGQERGSGMEETPDLEFNPRHPMVVRLNQLRSADAETAGMVAHQLLDQARLAAGLLEDPRTMLKRLNQLLGKVVGI